MEIQTTLLLKELKIEELEKGEAQRLEAEHLKVEREKLEKEKAEAETEAKRIEALRPDKEKLEKYIKSVIFSIEPSLKNKEAKDQLKLIQESLGEWSEIELNNLSNSLK